MEKFYTVIKVKENQLLEIQKKLHTKDIEIKKYKEDILKIEKQIIDLKKVEVNSQWPELYSIIDNLKSQWLNLENEMQIRIAERCEIFSQLMVKKQEIKSIEMLIEKKKSEFMYALLQKEQDSLDEMNAID